jgi:hypothetical protein
MTAQIIHFPVRQRRPLTTSYFGGCPECGSPGNFANIGRVHWAACSFHSVKWRVGENLFSGWRDECPEIWDRNAAELAEYREVTPVYPDRWAP